MTTHNRKFRRSWLSLCMPLLLSLSSAAGAAAVSLSQTPLFVQNNAKNNIMLVIDNSGSMDFEVLFHANDGGLWWNDTTQSFVNTSSSTVGSGYDTTAPGSVYWTGNSKKEYLFPNGTGTGNRVYTTDIGNTTVPPFIQYAFARSSDYNKAYYDPTQTYSPWPSLGTTTFANADPTAAMSDPTVSGSSTMNLTTDEQTTTQWWDFYMEAGMVMPKDTTWGCEGSGAWQTTSSDVTLAASGSACQSSQATDVPMAGVRLGVEYFPATYFTKTTTGAYTVDYQVTTGSGSSAVTTTYTATGDCDTPVVANYEYFQRMPSTLTATSGEVDALGPDGACLVKHEIKPANYATTAEYDTAIQNFANWYQYYRKRHLALRAGLGNAFESLTGTRVGYFTINNLPSATSPITMYDLDTASQKQTLFDDLYGIGGHNGGTNLRGALDRAGEQYMISGSGAPITEPCQKCFTILFTDGFNAQTSYSGVGNTDGATGTYSGSAPYSDSYSGTLGDIAMKYYTTNLRSDLTAGEVPIDSTCDSSTDTATSSNPSADCNPNLHMDTYTVGLDLEGTLFGQTFSSGGSTYSYNSVIDAYNHNPTWPDVTSARDPRQVDDLYHAAVDGRGEMYNASSTADIGTKLSDALKSISTHSGSAAAVSFNTSSLTSSSYLYLSIFDSTDWSGDLKGFPLDPSNGDVLGTNVISAQTQLDGLPPASRVILTYNGTSGTGVAFNTSNWSNLTTAEQDDLMTDTDGSTDSVDEGKARLGYIRGDQSCEQSQTSGSCSSYGTFSSQAFRDRNHILGDIVHSSPVYVGTPDMGWPDTAPFPTGTDAYSAFQTGAASSRTPMIYVGANDGMLHGFEASTMNEKLAYIPSNLFSTGTDEGLHYLTDPAYNHHYYVDLTPTVSDAFINGTWDTVLVGGERGGGRGIYALNVTSPSSFSESGTAPANTVMWEFTSADDPNLGYTFSRPTIAPTNVLSSDGTNVRWAAIFGNGYNSDNPTTDPSNPVADGKARLFIVFLDHSATNSWTGIDIEGSTIKQVTATTSTTLTSSQIGSINWATVDYISIEADDGTSTSTTSNGLSTPAVVDTSGDGVPDRVYAGDLHGNMWAFDISSSDPSKWNVAHKSGSTYQPLFTTQANQPITTQPVVIDNPAVTSSNSNSPNLLVLFGTGQYLTTGDITSTDTQSVYGVWDSGTGGLDYTSLQQQTLDSAYSTSSTLRVVTDTPVNYSSSGGSQQYGWYFNLPATGERMVSNPLVRDGIFYYNTTIPSTDACSYGGNSWLMAVDAVNGGSSSTPVFDSNNSGTVDNGDLLTSTDGTSTAAAAGQELSGSGIASAPATLGNYQYTATTKTTDNTGINKRTLATIDNLHTGRLGWKELGR